MTLLTDGEISRYRGGFAPDNFDIFPWNLERVQPASVDVTMGGEVLKMRPSTRPLPQTEEKTEWDKLIGDSERGFRLIPGQFYLGHTEERFRLGNQIAMQIEGKSTWGRKGLEVHSTAGWVDPGFCGQLTLEIKVVGVNPVWVRPGEAVAQVCVFRLNTPALFPYGEDRGSHYQDQIGATPPWRSEDA